MTDISNEQPMYGKLNESKGDNALVSETGLKVKDLKAKNLEEKPNSKKLISFSQLTKIIGSKKPNIMDKMSPAIVKDLDEEVEKEDDEDEDSCEHCKCKECECDKFSDEEVDKIADSATDDDYADVYGDHEFAVVDEDGKIINESIIDDEVINEVLSREARIRKGAIFALNQSKIERKRMIALHKYSSGRVLSKRARRMAVSLIKKRLASGKDYSKLSVGEKERIDSRVLRMKNTIARVALKLTSKIRKIEKERMSHHKYTKGK